MRPHTRLVDILRERHDRNGRVPPHTDEYPEEQRGDAWEPPPPSANGTHQSEPKDPQPGVLLSTVKPEQVSWLWPGRIPLGKLTILDGDPGLGKSVLTMDLAASVTRGFAMADGTDGVHGGVIVLNAEDGLADTVVPRLLAAGADLSRILALDAIQERESERAISLPADLDYLEEAIERMSALLVIVDPLMAFLAAQVNSHRDQDCRRALHPLAKMAEQTGAAVLVVRHLNKMTAGNPLYRGGGSIGIIGAARSGLLVAKDPDDPNGRVLASTKSNLAKLPISLAFDLSKAEDGALRLGWKGESTHTAESLLAAPRDDEDRDALGEATDVLRTILESGTTSAPEVTRDARKAGVSEITLKRAKARLGIRSRKVGFGNAGVWHWYLPSQNMAESP